MKNIFFLLIIFSLIVSVHAEDEQVLHPDTIVNFQDGDYSRQMTASEMWAELEQYENEMRVSHNAYEEQSRDGEEMFVVPMAPQTVSNLKEQAQLFQTSTIVPAALSAPRGTHSEYRLNVSYNKVWGSTSLFAAYVDAKAEVYGSKEMRKFHAHLYGGGYVFKKQVKAIEFNADVSEGANGVAATSLRIFGKTKFSSSHKTLNKKIFFTGEKGAKKRFFIGPVPVSVHGAIGGTAGMETKISVLSNGLQGNITPAISSFGKASASIDIWLAKAGVQGNLVLLNDNVPASLSVQLQPQSRLAIALDMQNNLQALSGKLSVYAKIRKVWKFWKKSWKTYSKTLFNWSGFRKNWKLIDRDLKIALK